MVKFLALLTGLLFSAVAPVASAAAEPDLNGVTGLQPGLWSIATHGTNHVMGYDLPFSKTFQQCIQPGKEHTLILPKNAGKCSRKEHTDGDGTMHWHMNCLAKQAKVDYQLAIRTAQHHFTVQGQMSSNNPESTTDYQIEGEWQNAACP